MGSFLLLQIGPFLFCIVSSSLFPPPSFPWSSSGFLCGVHNLCWLESSASWAALEWDLSFWVDARIPNEALGGVSLWLAGVETEWEWEQEGPSSETSARVFSYQLKFAFPFAWCYIGLWMVLSEWREWSVMAWRYGWELPAHPFQVVAPFTLRTLSCACWRVAVKFPAWLAQSFSLWDFLRFCVYWRLDTLIRAGLRGEKGYGFV